MLVWIKRGFRAPGSPLSPAFRASRRRKKFPPSPHFGDVQSLHATGLIPDQHVSLKETPPKASAGRPPPQNHSIRSIRMSSQTVGILGAAVAAEGCPVRACICQVFGPCARRQHGNQRCGKPPTDSCRRAATPAHLNSPANPLIVSTFFFSCFWHLSPGWPRRGRNFSILRRVSDQLFPGRQPNEILSV